MDNGRTIFIIALIMGFATLANSIPLTMKDVESNATQLQIQLKKISRKAQDLITLLDQTALKNVSGFSWPLSNGGSSSASSTVLNLQNKMSEIQTKFTNLEKKLSSHTGQQSHIREQLSSLETEFRTLSVRLDAEKKLAAQTVEGHGSALTELTASHNSLKKAILELHEKLKAKEQQELKNRLPDECIKDIKSHDFKTAEKKLELMNDSSSKIKYIIKEVYKSQLGNFDLVLQFGDSVSNTRSSLQIFEALEFEMESSGHRDPLKMMLLVDKLIEKGLPASSLITNLIVSIRTVAKEQFKDAVVTRNPLNSAVKALSDSLYQFDPFIFNKVIEDVITDMYSSQHIMLDFSYWEYQLVGDIRKLYPGKLGQHDSEWGSVRDKFIPTVVSAIALNKPVCIGGTGFSLCADSDRNVKANGAYPASNNCKWKIEIVGGNVFTISNFQYNTQYLYVPKASKYIKTYEYGGLQAVDDQGKWRIKRGNEEKSHSIRNVYYRTGVCYKASDLYAVECEPETDERWTIDVNCDSER